MDIKRIFKNTLNKSVKNISVDGRHLHVFVGMSGGVDSSVSAGLLKEQGYDVTGVFIKVWQPDFMPCSWKEERRDAMRVAAHLNIPFITLDLQKEYKKEVVDYMIQEYKSGRTPNPDVMCNRYVKFGGFYDWAIEHGADYVATGHYARIGAESLTSKDIVEDDHQHTLLKGRDDNKDQSYFLWTLTSEKLKHVLFPIGNIEKPEVRKLAKKFKLPNAEKKDSQGLCFVGKVDMKEFLKHFINEKPGQVLNKNGEAIGHHEGSFFYTLGERHGFVITKKTPDDKPYFVIGKDTEKNTITVLNMKIVEDDHQTNHSHEYKLININWIGRIPEKGKIYECKVRYRGKLNPITIDDNKIKVSGDELIAEGQSIVIYDGEECLGGGIYAHS